MIKRLYVLREKINAFIAWIKLLISKLAIDKEDELPPGEKDVHASKISPDDPRLKLSRPKNTYLKKKPVFVLIGLLTVVVFIAIFFAFTPKKIATYGENTDEALTSNTHLSTLPNFISQPIEDYMKPSLSNESLPVEETSLPVSSSNTQQGSNVAQPKSVESEEKDAIARLEFEKEQLELEKARRSSIFFKPDNLSATSSNDDRQTVNAAEQAEKMNQIMKIAQSGSTEGFNRQDDPNKQGRKNEFLNGKGEKESGYLDASMKKPLSPYEVKAGSVIPTVLITGINSDLPGEIIAQVRENVFDTVTGNYLLIPQGSKLLAAYDSMVAYGQERVLVCWNRLIRPDGSSINLKCAPGVDLAGQAGFADEVDNHWSRLIAGVLLSSVLSATATTSQGSDFNEDDASFNQLFAANVGTSFNDAGQQITRKNLNIQPTITVRPGFSVNVLVNKDLIIPPYTE